MEGLAQGVLHSSDEQFHKNQDEMLNRFTSKASRSLLKTSDYWLLLTKFLQRLARLRCPQASMRHVQQRLQNRLVEASDVGPPLAVGHMNFYRMVLKRCPLLVENNKFLLTSVAHKAVDSAAMHMAGEGLDTVDPNTDPLVRLAMNVYVGVEGMGEQAKLLRTIHVVMTQDPPYSENIDEEGGILQLSCINSFHGTDRLKLVSLFWALYSLMLEQASEGADLDVEAAAGAFDVSLCANTLLQRCATRAMLMLARCAGTGFSSVSRRLVASIMAKRRQLNNATVWEFSAALNNLLGMGSTLHEYFNELCSLMTKALHREEEMQYAELAGLVISILRTSAPLLASASIYELQLSICRSALAPSPSLVALKLMNAMMECGHEEVPIPLQVAQCVFTRLSHQIGHHDQADYVREIQRGNSIVCAYSRPRLTSLTLPVLKFSEHKADGNASAKARCLLYSEPSEKGMGGERPVPDDRRRPLGSHQVDMEGISEGGGGLAVTTPFPSSTETNTSSNQERESTTIAPAAKAGSSIENSNKSVTNKQSKGATTAAFTPNALSFCASFESEIQTMLADFHPN